MAEDQDAIRLLLFIAGSAPNSARALMNVRAIRERLGRASVELEVVDVFADPQRALGAGVVVTPMLVVASGSSSRAVVGTLDDVPLVLATLGLEPAR